MWRSEDMSLIMLTMQKEAAHNTVEMLGDLSLVEFKDVRIRRFGMMQKKFSPKKKKKYS